MMVSHSRSCSVVLTNKQATLDPTFSIILRQQESQDKALINPESPITCLPIEILGEIFAICVCTSLQCMKDSLDLSCAPWLLTRVCKLWTDVALSMPQLWSTFKIYLDPHNKNTSTVHLADLHLERSHSLPLNIQANFTPYPHSVIHPLLERVLKHSQRWKFVRFNQACHGALSKLSDMPLAFPLLQEVVLLSGWNQPAILEAFSHAPLLHTLSIHGFRLGHPPRAPYTAFPYHQTTKLFVSHIPIREVIWIMAQIPAVEECILNDCFLDDSPSELAEKIHFPHLVSLAVKTSYAIKTQQPPLQFLKLISAPQLSELSIEVAGTNVDGCVQTFLCQSLPHLEKLSLFYSTLSGTYIDGAAVLGILSQVPTLRRLQMGGFTLNDEVIYGILSPNVTYSSPVPCLTLESLEFHGCLNVEGEFFQTVILPQIGNAYPPGHCHLKNRMNLSWLAPMRPADCLVKSYVILPSKN